MMNILVAHSWSRNVGDMALLSTTIRMLEEAAPGACITALVAHPEFVRERCNLNARLERWPWPLERRRWDIILYPAIYLSHVLSVLAYRLFKARIFLFKKYERPLSAIFDTDVLVSPGGDFISPRYGFITTFSEFLFAKILGKKLIIFPQTIGPFTGLLNGSASSYVLNMADLILVREHETKRLLERIGVADAVVTADVVFTFPSPPETKRKNRVIICAEDIPGGYETYLEGLAKMIKREGLEVVFMAANGGDITINERLAKKTGTAVIKEIHPPEKVARILSGSEFLVSSRMHPIVLGTLSSTPFFAIGDSFKFRAVLGDLCEDCWTKTDGISIERIMDRIRDRERLREEIGMRLPQVQERSRESIRILRKEFS